MQKRHSLVVAALLLLLTACTKPTPSPSTATPPPSPVATTVPTSLPTPTAARPVMVLVSAADAAPETVAVAQEWLQARAQEADAQMVVLEPDAALPEHTVAVLGVGTAPPAAGEDVRRLMIAPAGTETPAGVQVVRLENAGLPERAFLAGYLGVVITKDWRTGLLASEAESPAAAAFEHGGRYYCGLCRPLHPPYQVYPQYFLLPANSDAAAWQAGVQQLTQAGVQTIALSPEAMRSMETFPQGITLIALDTPPAAQANAFAAAITTDLFAALDALWAQPDLQSTLAPIRLTVLDANAIGPGRAALVEEVRERLQNGLIQP